MSDDDFVTKPIRTYKRKRRKAPHVLPANDHIENVAEPCILSCDSYSALSNLSKSPEKPVTPVSNPKCRRLSTETAPTKISERKGVSNSMTDLDVFLNSKNEVLGRSVFTGHFLPDLEIETVPRDEDDMGWDQKNEKPPRVEEKVVIKEQIADIKLASKTLCDRYRGKHLKQTSLFGMKKSVDKPEFKSPIKDQPKTLEDKKSTVPKVQSPRKSDNKALTVSPKSAKAPLQPRKLVKQSGTSQLDLGAMFGLAPKHSVASKPAIKPDKPNIRKVPFYKWVKGTSFTVDAFNFGEIPKCTAYFLSHFHSDHYMGLNKNFSGELYCSQVTANYVINNLKVNSDRVNVLQFDKTELVQGIRVSLITANHCPGSAMFLFESPTVGAVLHTGDFRYDRGMLEHDLLKGKSIDVLYLDTTYMDPLYRFPPQKDVIQFICERVLEFTPDTLVVCGSYTIGKERIVEGITSVLNCKICVNQTKMNLIKLQGNSELSSRLTKSINSRVHIVPMKEINPGSLSKLLARTTYTSVVGVKPTGWTHTQNTNLTDIKPIGRGKVRIYSVPYSEHSSYSELEEFVRKVSVKKVISTVMPRTEEKRKLMFQKLKEWTSQ